LGIETDDAIGIGPFVCADAFVECTAKDIGGLLTPVEDHMEETGLTLRAGFRDINQATIIKTVHRSFTVRGELGLEELNKCTGEVLGLRTFGV
jgi:hypothetical protein